MGGAYFRREICVSKSAGLGGKFVSAIFPCENDNIGALTTNSWQLNFSEHANFKHNSNKLYWEWKFGFRVAGSNFLANTSSMDRRSPRREWGVHYENDNKLNKKKLNHNGTDMCNLLWFILYLRANPKYKPQGAYIRRGLLSEGFLRFEFEGLIFGGAYFRNFTVLGYVPWSFASCFVLTCWDWVPLFAYAVRIASVILRTSRLVCAIYAAICVNATAGG